MVSRQTKSISLSALIREHPTIAEILWMSAPGVRESLDDRSVAILEAAQLERSLESIITHRLIKLDDSEKKELFAGDSAPLATFSAKTKIAYALGMFGKNTKKELDRIRGIRNAFAHSSKPLNFSTKQIETECNNLTRTFVGNTPMTSRDKYIQSASNLSASLLSLKYPRSEDSDFDPLD